MSSMRSASSNTKWSTRAKVNARLCKWSNKSPGRGHHHVRPIRNGAALLIITHPADNGGHLEPRELASRL
jgi:hypothetical protein